MTKPMTVKSIMHDITVISYDAPVLNAVQIMANKDIGSILVEKDGKISGILTERDVLKKLIADEKDPKGFSVGDLCSSELLTINANATILEASDILKAHNIRRLPVEENGKIIGMVTARNVGQHVHDYYKMVVEDYLTKLIDKLDKFQ